MSTPVASRAGFGDWLLRPFLWYQAWYEARYERRIVARLTSATAPQRRVPSAPRREPRAAPQPSRSGLSRLRAVDGAVGSQLRSTIVRR